MRAREENVLRRRRTALQAATLLVAIACVAYDAPSASARPHPPRVVSLPVAFRVVNSNTSAAPCSSDGAAYTVRGHLIGPRSALSNGRGGAITAYLYGYEGGEWNWDLRSPPGYAYANQMARRGHVSLTLDELGYGKSDRPADGNGICVGSEADMTHQIIEQLRHGSYRPPGRAHNAS